MSHPTKKVPREVADTYCDDPTCAYYGKLAQQGVCFSDEASTADWEKLAKHEEELTAEMQRYLDKHGQTQYVKYLEAVYVTAVQSWDLTLDELIRLRMENRALKEKS